MLIPLTFQNTGGLDALLRGLAGQCQQAVDLNIVDDLHNFLFGIPGAGGLDLFALNLQRTRDHGAALYNDARKFYSLPEFSSFDQITSNPLIAERLAVAYRNNISAVETYVGGLAEGEEAIVSLCGFLDNTFFFQTCTPRRE